MMDLINLESAATSQRETQPATIGNHERLWRRKTRLEEPKTIFVLARINCKIETYFELTRQVLKWYSVGTDTGAVLCWRTHR